MAKRKNQTLYDPAIFGELVWMRLHQWGDRITLRRAAAQMDVDKSALSRVIHNKPVSTDNFLRIALWAQVPGVHELVRELNIQMPEGGE